MNGIHLKGANQKWSMLLEKRTFFVPRLEKSLFYTLPSPVLYNAADVVASLLLYALFEVLVDHLLTFLQVNDLSEMSYIRFGSCSSSLV